MDHKREKPTLPDGRSLFGAKKKEAQDRLKDLLNAAKSHLDSRRFEDAIDAADIARRIAKSEGLALPAELLDVERISNAKAGLSYLDSFQVLLEYSTHNSRIKEIAKVSLENARGYVSQSGGDVAALDRLTDHVTRLKKTPSERPTK